MGRTLFIGDSHTMGYVETGHNDDFKIWNDNNYAELYSEITDKDVVVMASSGCGNREYVNFLGHALKTYTDIEEVFIQSTYWGRFPIAINPTLNEKEILPLSFYMHKEESSTDNIHRWSIGLVQQEEYMQIYLKPHPIDFDIPYIKTTSPYSQPDVRRSSYMYVKMYHYLQTHLEQQDFFRDVLLCDTLCRNKNIPLYIWKLNERVFIPKETDNFYAPLTNTKIINTSAKEYIQDNHGINIDDEKADSEHYNKTAHALIAEHYITYLKEQQ